MRLWPFARRAGGNRAAPATPAATDAAGDLALHQWLDGLYWQTRQRLDGLRLGQHPGWLRGSGLDLADLREYQPGDDVRHIDWASSARLQQPHVRVFHEDRDVCAWFVLDASPSSRFGSTGRSQHDTAVGHAGILARLLLRQGNRLGAIVQTEPGHMQVLPARGGKAQLWQLTRTLKGRLPPHAAASPSKPDAHTPQDITPLGTMLREAAAVIRQRAAVFVLSDFISQPGWGQALGQLGQRHDVLAIHLIDPMQSSLPDAGLLPMRDPETGEMLWVDTSNPRIRLRHAQLAGEQAALRQAEFTLSGVDVLELSTEEDLPSAVLRQLQMRQPRASTSPHRPSIPGART